MECQEGLVYMGPELFLALSWSVLSKGDLKKKRENGGAKTYILVISSSRHLVHWPIIEAQDQYKVYFSIQWTDMPMILQY